MNVRHLIQQLAPLAPPCFSSRLDWLEFLVSAAQAQCKGERGPLTGKETGSPQFDYTLDYCQDCTAAFRDRMEDESRCRPMWLKQMVVVEVKIRPLDQPLKVP